MISLNKIIIVFLVFFVNSVTSDNSCIQETITDCGMNVYCVTQVIC